MCLLITILKKMTQDGANKIGHNTQVGRFLSKKEVDAHKFMLFDRKMAISDLGLKHTSRL